MNVPPNGFVTTTLETPSQIMTRLMDRRLALLVLRCQTGDEAAFTQLLNAFGPKTMNYLKGAVADDAEDVQQDVWLTVYNQIRTLDDPTRFRTWLYRLTRNRAIDSIRKRRRLDSQLSTEDVDIPAPELEDDLAPEDVARLHEAIDQLSPLHREVVLLRLRGELSHEEIALVLGCPVATVRTRFHHAKRHLRILLGERPT